MAAYVGSVTLLSRRGLEEVRSIAWDATVTESHTLANDITDHPVEEGSNVADHIRRKPDVLVIEAMVTDTPLTDDGTVVESASAALVEGRAVAIYNQLRELAAGQVFTVTTGVRDYDSMAIEGIDLPRSLQTGKALRFTLRMKQIRIVRTKIVNLPKTNLARAKPKQKLGKATIVAFAEAAEAVARAQLLTDPYGFAALGRTVGSGL